MDMNNYVGGVISPYGSPENEDSETYEGLALHAPTAWKPEDRIHNIIDSSEREYYSDAIKKPESEIQKHTRAIMARVTAKPGPHKAMKDIAKSSKKTTKAFRKFNDKMPLPGANLTYRPFLILSTIRDEFSE